MPTVISISGAVDANSYISEADAEVYFTNVGVPAVWAAATTAQKQSALIAGTQYLDAKYARRWSGLRATFEQRLAWPRTNVYDSDSFIVEGIPRNVQEATAEAAIRSLNGNLTDDTGYIRAESVKVGEIETSTQYSGGKSSRPGFTIIDQLLSYFVGGSSFDRS